jgi:hypothetical protein
VFATGPILPATMDVSLAAGAVRAGAAADIYVGEYDGTITHWVNQGSTVAPARVTVPTPPVVEATGPQGAVVTFAATADDGSAVTCSPASGTRFPVGTTTVSCTAAGGGTASFAVTVQDTRAPILAGYDNMVFEATGPDGAIATYAPTATDVVDGAVPVRCTPASGTTFPIGVWTIVSCSATDAHGNTAYGTFPVFVRDTTAPVLNVPGDVVAEATGPAGAQVVYGAVTASDAVDGAIEPWCSWPSGITVAIGVTTVDCMAYDKRGNYARASFRIVVRDTTAPVVTVPADVTADATGPNGAVVAYGAATATDTVDGALAATCSPARGSTFAVGVTTVTCSATDAHGNTGSASFRVVVTRDTTPPVLTLPSGVTVDATGAAGGAATWTATAVDAISGSVAVTCTPASGTTFRVGDTVVRCSAADAAGNAASGSFTVHVRGAAEQLADLTDDVADIGPGNSLTSKLGNGGCGGLAAFVNEVQAQSGKSIPAAQAADLVATANRIRSLLGC